MRKTFKKLLAATLACAMVCTLTPSIASADVGALPPAGSVDGEGNLVTYDPTVLSVVVPTSIDFKADPQGLLNYSLTGHFDESKAGSIIAGNAVIVNKSSIPVAVTLTPVATAAGSGATNLQYKTDADAVKASTGSALDVAIHLIPAATPAYDVAGDDITVSGAAITVNNEKTVSSNTGFPITETSEGSANKITFQLDKAHYEPDFSGTAGSIDENNGHYTFKLVNDLENMPDAIGFTIGGAVNPKADWNGSNIQKMGVSIKYSFDKLVSYDENAEFKFGPSNKVSTAHGVTAYQTSGNADAKGSAVEIINTTVNATKTFTANADGTKLYIAGGTPAPTVNSIKVYKEAEYAANGASATAVKTITGTVSASGNILIPKSDLTGLTDTGSYVVVFDLSTGIEIAKYIKVTTSKTIALNAAGTNYYITGPKSPVSTVTSITVYDKADYATNSSSATPVKVITNHSVSSGSGTISVPKTELTSLASGEYIVVYILSHGTETASYTKA